jgi:3-deoxy-7-phosphoheptulonate synthase
MTTQHTTDDLRVNSLTPLITPAQLIETLPLDTTASALIARQREQATRIIQQQDPRLLVVVGPCSIHDPQAALEYAQRLARCCERFQQELLIIMRVYFEKPRTRTGWKGLINDPHLDASFDVNQGLYTARKLLLDLAQIGVPAATEFLDSIIPQFIADAITWSAIGARTTESQMHRELASGLSMPVGFKNGTDGNVAIAIDAVSSSAQPHHFLSITKQGSAAIVSTQGNQACHVILRGANHGSNYHHEIIQQVSAQLHSAELQRGIMVDCSHGNSQKQHTQQAQVVDDICAQLTQGEQQICGVMLESNLIAGKQVLTHPATLRYGQSITDSCIGWEETEQLLTQLAQAVRAHRLVEKSVGTIS